MFANLCQAAERPRIGLDGEWGFRLDPQNVGVSEHWFEEPGQLSSTIKVPDNFARGVKVSNALLQSLQAK
jgi:beta-galactosidase/beta-glucuronidase